MEKAQVTTQTASGTFEVKMAPQGEPDAGPGAQLARMALDKQFHGDLEAVGKGEMLTAMTETKGSAGYVAIERVTGTLHGRSGSFVFLHRGLMSAAGQELSITVIPDSGSDELTGIAGEFKIDIVDGEHSYNFSYSLPAAPDA